MSFKNNILWGSDDKDDVKKKEAPKPVSTTHPSFINSYSTGPVVTHDNAMVDAAQEKLRAAIKSQKSPGIGYAEYMNSKNKMLSITDEGQRFDTAFQALSSVGLTKDGLISTAKSSLMIVDSELQKFETAYKDMHNTKVDIKKNAIISRQQQIQNLTVQIQQLTQQNDQDTNAVNDAENTMSVQHEVFIEAASELKQSIQSDIDKINQYIQPI
jgi:hypothetical protein